MALETALQSDRWEAAARRNGHFHLEVLWGKQGPANRRRRWGGHCSPTCMSGGLAMNSISLCEFGQVTACPGLMKTMRPKEWMVWGKSHRPCSGESINPTGCRTCTQPAGQEQAGAPRWHGFQDLGHFPLCFENWGVFRDFVHLEETSLVPRQPGGCSQDMRFRGLCGETGKACTSISYLADESQTSRLRRQPHFSLRKVGTSPPGETARTLPIAGGRSLVKPSHITWKTATQILTVSEDGPAAELPLKWVLALWIYWLSWGTGLFVPFGSGQKCHSTGDKSLQNASF